MGDVCLEFGVDVIGAGVELLADFGDEFGAVRLIRGAGGGGEFDGVGGLGGCGRWFWRGRC